MHLITCVKSLDIPSGKPKTFPESYFFLFSGVTRGTLSNRAMNSFFRFQSLIIQNTYLTI